MVGTVPSSVRVVSEEALRGESRYNVMPKTLSADSYQTLVEAGAVVLTAKVEEQPVPLK